MTYELPETVRRSRASAAAKLVAEHYGFLAAGEICYNEIGRYPTMTEREIANFVGRRIEETNKRMTTGEDNAKRYG